ncbi:methylated-DNA--[protein]-cysteine S-methyltransferase [Sphingobium lignivorans]|uniref:Methylated-DNA--protein-cysteine methyltransferase n=1 Tax=Sphingobium lignivorans TaxID=2735886 RepID=A0ABR6NIV3_9SPHN|nr:methylated-DNA--[protein]-cysteine S-methyltransferase [Sphingobium lignivorans]MBB5986438.1 methylated-DNA-[protein]-cysteine S-methyltransferase [Sphingobium lignivorans]
MSYAVRTMNSPLGVLTLLASERGLSAVLWENDDPARVKRGPRVEAGDHPMLDEAARQLGGYFDGTRQRFDLPLDFEGTDFQKQVWTALLAIPFGETRSYADIARAIGRPSAVRAVGAANGRNPISIVAPCHRVVGADGALTGFAGGLAAKRFLLALEGMAVPVDAMEGGLFQVRM